LIEDFFRECITLELDDDTDSFLVRLISDICDTDDDLLHDEISDFFDEFFFIELIWYLSDDDRFTSVLPFLDIHTTTEYYRSTSTSICFEDIFFVIDDTSCRKIWSMDIVHEIFDHDILRILMSEDIGECVDDFCEIVGRDIGRHTDGDTHDSVQEEIRDTGWEDTRLSRTRIIVGSPVDSIFLYIGEHELSELVHLHFSITHRCSTITIHRTEVSLTIDERITQRKILCHTNHRFIDRRVTMWMIFTENISDDTSRLSILSSSTDTTLIHRIEYSAMYRLESITDIRESTRDDD
jgi:hypothetical protein